jgi:hypothetical protein
MTRLFGFLLLALWSACAARSNADARIRTALDVLGEAIDPAQQLAVEGCDRRERLEVAAVRVDAGTASVAAERISQIRVRCNVVLDAFEAIRAAQLRAVQLLDETRDLDAAAAELERVRALWRDLDGADAGAP